MSWKTTASDNNNRWFENNFRDVDNRQLSIDSAIHRNMWIYRTETSCKVSHVVKYTWYEFFVYYFRIFKHS